MNSETQLTPILRIQRAPIPLIYTAKELETIIPSLLSLGVDIQSPENYLIQTNICLSKLGQRNKAKVLNNLRSLDNIITIYNQLRVFRVGDQVKLALPKIASRPPMGKTPKKQLYCNLYHSPIPGIECQRGDNCPFTHDPLYKGRKVPAIASKTEGGADFNFQMISESELESGDVTNRGQRVDGQSYGGFGQQVERQRS